jgi:hypothetical protein
MTVIDLSPQLDELRLKYPQWWRSEEAQIELQALWGNAECNEHGVLPAQERIEIELPAQSQWKAAVKIARAPNGWYAFATSYSYALGGGSAPISVWNATAYTTREEAIDAGITELKRKFECLRDWKGYAPDSQTTNAARMTELLDQYLHQSRQMTLF